MPFWLPFGFVSVLFFGTCFNRFSRSAFYDFWVAPGLHFGSSLGSKIDLDPPGERKGRASKNKFYLSKTILFDLGGGPGPVKIALESPLKFDAFF